jgi:UDP-N-acetylmuramoyl-L-alanyl-D-glutamate--2,6-diaminopimelate ligase
LLPEITAGCLTYGLHAEADVSASVIERFPSEQTFLLSAGTDAAPVRTRIIGDQHISNCLAAAAAGLTFGIELETIVRGLENVDRVPGRMERLECGQPFGVFIDAANSPQSLTLAIKSLRQVTPGRVFVVVGSDNRNDATRNALLGRIIERGAHVPVITSNEPWQQKPLRTAHEILDGFLRPHKAQVIPNRLAAIQFALSHARPGDSVLITGRGDRVTTAANDSQQCYDDREFACQCLYGQNERPVYPSRFRVVG